MITLTDLFQPDVQDASGAVGYSDDIIGRMQYRLVSAYGALFSGRGTKEDADLVLVDLAQFTRYVNTTSLATPADVVKALDQRRAVFARVVEAVIQAGGDMDGLHKAVLVSPPLSAEEA